VEKRDGRMELAEDVARMEWQREEGERESERQNHSIGRQQWMNRSNLMLITSKMKAEPGHLVERERKDPIVVGFRSFCCFVASLHVMLASKRGGGGTDSDQLVFFLLLVLLFTFDFCLFLIRVLLLDQVATWIGFGFCAKRLIDFSSSRHQNVPSSSFVCPFFWLFALRLLFF